MSAERMNTDVVHPYVGRYPGVQGGRPVIVGTRFLVSSIVQNHRRGLTVDEILDEFPSLKPAEVYDALSYYYDHRPQVDAEIDDFLDIESAMRMYPPTVRPDNDGR